MKLTLRRVKDMLIVTHPTGLWLFHDYATASAFCDDIGNMYDLNAIGTLKSRCHIIHLN